MNAPANFRTRSLANCVADVQRQYAPKPLPPETRSAMERGAIEAADQQRWDRPWASNREEITQ